MVSEKNIIETVEQTEQTVEKFKEVLRYAMGNTLVEVYDKKTGKTTEESLYKKGGKKSEELVDELTRNTFEHYLTSQVVATPLDIAKDMVNEYLETPIETRGEVNEFGLPDPHNPDVLDKSMRPIDDRRNEGVPEAVSELNKEGHRLWYTWIPYHLGKVDKDPTE